MHQRWITGEMPARLDPEGAALYSDDMGTTNKAKLMDGRALATRLLEAAAVRIETIHKTAGMTPALATVLVGDDSASATYVRMKRKRCEDVGMKSLLIELPVGTTTEELVAEIEKLAADKSVHGILVQHPVPKPIDKRTAFEAIPIEKDVDGVTSSTLGRVILGLPAFIPCTPASVQTMAGDMGSVPPVGSMPMARVPWDRVPLAVNMIIQQRAA